MQRGTIRGSVHGGAHIVDEESKDNSNYLWSINKDRASDRPDTYRESARPEMAEDKQPLIEGGAMEVNIA